MIREGKIDDSSKIAKIKIDNWRKTYLNIFPDDFLKSLNLDEEIEKYKKGFSKRKVIVYEKDGEVIAYCYYGERKEKTLEEYSGEVFALYVKNDCQEHGIGTRLLQDAIKDLSKEHKKIMLWCAKKNTRAISFYQKNGLKLLDEEKENIGGEEVEKVALGISSEEQNGDGKTSYRLKKSANYIENKDNIAIYTNPDLIFLKDEPRKWFKQIVNQEKIANIPEKFVRYLLNRGIIEDCNNCVS